MFSTYIPKYGFKFHVTFLVILNVLTLSLTLDLVRRLKYQRTNDYLLSTKGQGLGATIIVSIGPATISSISIINFNLTSLKAITIMTKFLELNTKEIIS